MLLAQPGALRTALGVVPFGFQRERRLGCLAYEAPETMLTDAAARARSIELVAAIRDSLVPAGR